MAPEDGWMVLWVEESTAMHNGSLPSTATAVRRNASLAIRALVLAFTLQLLWCGWAMAGFTVHGQKVPTIETNFAGDRQMSPRFKVVIQINHDTEQTRDLELTIVDDIFQTLLTDYRRDPFLP